MTLVTKSVSPAQITASQNNYAPGDGSFYRLTSNGAYDITGVSISNVAPSGSQDGAILTFLNVGSFVLTFKHQSTSSLAQNRFQMGSAADVAVGAGQSITFTYDTTDQRFKQTGTTITSAGDVGGSGTTGKLVKFTAASTIGDSVVTESGGNIGIGTASPSVVLDVRSAGSASSVYNLAYFASTTDPATAGNLYSIAVDALNRGTLIMGVNKSTATGSVPGNSAFLSTWASTGTISIGRGNNANLPNTSDIFIGSTGNVGIGTTSPGVKLHVEVPGAATIAGMAAFFRATGAANVAAIDIEKSGTGSLFMGVNKNTTSGQVPADMPFISTYNTLQSLSIGRGGANDLPNYADIHIATSGYVGIGTTSPDRQLVVNGGSLTFDVPVVRFDNAGTVDYIQGLHVMAPNMTNHITGVAIGHDFSTRNAATIGFKYAGSGSTSNYVYIGGHSVADPFVITMGGNVGIGTTSPSDRLHVRNDANSITGFRIQNNNAAGVSGGTAHCVVLATDGTYESAMLLWPSDHAEPMIANAAGWETTRPNGMVFEMSQSAGDWKWIRTTGGTYNLRMLLTNAGFLGIGTTNPAQKLTVTGGNISLPTGGSKLMFDGTSIVGPTGSLRMQSNSSGLTAVAIIPNGTQTARNTIFDIFNTDYAVDSTNYEAFSYHSHGSGGYAGIANAYVLATKAGGTGSHRPIILGHYVGAEASVLVNLCLATSGNVGVNTTSPNAALDVNGDLATRATSPSAFTGTQNDYAVGSFSFARLSGSSTPIITGIVANNQDGHRLTLVNVGSTDIVLKNQDTGSTAANRIITSTGSSIILKVDATLDLIYDATTARWRTSPGAIVEAISTASYSELYFDNDATPISIAIGTAGTYEAIPTNSWTVGSQDINGNAVGSAANSNIAIGTVGAGDYKVSGQITFGATNNGDEIHWALFKNGTTQITKIKSGLVFQGTVHYASISVSGILTLAATDTVELKVTDEDNTDTVLVYHANFSIKRVSQ